MAAARPWPAAAWPLAWPRASPWTRRPPSASATSWGPLGGLPAEVEHCALLAANTLIAACEDAARRMVSDGKPECGSCADASCAARQRLTGESEEAFAERQQLQANLCRIGKKILVLSGKGGVGKSTVAVNLAVAFVLAGRKAGLLDVDIHGPSIPTMLGLEAATVQEAGGKLVPVETNGLKVLSLGFFLKNPDDAVIWRGPMKMKAIQQFLSGCGLGRSGCAGRRLPARHRRRASLRLPTARQGGWGGDRHHPPEGGGGGRAEVHLVLSPGGGPDPRADREHERLCVSPLRRGDVRSSRSGGGSRIAADMGVPFLGSIPLDPKIAEACDEGRAYIAEYAQSPTATIMRDIVARLGASDGTPDVERGGTLVHQPAWKAGRASPYGLRATEDFVGHAPRSRSRNHDCSGPPPQIRTSGITA